MPGGIEPPLSVIESWPLPNAVNPETHDNTLLILTITLSVLAVLIVAARFYCRLCLTRNAGADDWMLLLGMFPTIGFAVSIALSSQYYGFRNHVWDIDHLLLFSSRKITFANELLYLVASVLIKLSILLFYRRLAEGILPMAFRYSTWAIAIFVIAYFIAALVSLCFTCQPFSGFWWRIYPFWRDLHPDACINEGVAIITISTISALQDFLIALLPTLLFLRLPMPSRQKFALGAVFGLGFFLCVAGVLRIVYVKRVFYDTYDATWELYNVWLWMIVEVLLAPIVASAPALRVLCFSYILPRFGVTYSFSQGMTTHVSGHGATRMTDLSRSCNRDSLREGATILPDDENDEAEDRYSRSEPSTTLTASPKKHADDEGWFHTIRDTDSVDGARNDRFKSY